MKRKIFVFLLAAIIAFSGLTSLPISAYQASDLENTNAAAAIFQASDEIFQSFNPEAIYEGVKKILDLPQALNFWDTDFFSDLKVNMADGFRKTLKEFEKPDLLETAIAEAYEAQNDTDNPLNKSFAPNQVRFLSPTEFEVPSVYKASVTGNTLFIKADDGSFEGDVDFKVDPTLPDTLTITITDQIKHEAKSINLNLIDDGAMLTTDDTLLFMMTIDNNNTVTFSNPEEGSDINTIGFDKENHAINFASVSPEKQQSATIVLDPQNNFLSVSIEDNEVFSAIFDKANAELNVNIMGSSNVLQFIDAEKSISGMLEIMQAAVNLRFDNVGNRIAVELGGSPDEMMEMFALNVDKEAKSFSIVAFGSPIFQVMIDSSNRTVTIVDEKGEEQTLTEDDLNQLIEQMSKSAVPGSAADPETVTFE